MSKKLKLITRCCDNVSVHDLEKMYAAGKSVSFKTFFSKVNLQEVSQYLGYSYGKHKKEQRGLHLKKDWAVKDFFRSTFKGKPVYYMVWSQIDHIFG